MPVTYVLKETLVCGFYVACNDLCRMVKGVKSGVPVYE